MRAPLNQEIILKRYAIGFFVGILVGTAASALAVNFAGGNGYLINWSVLQEGVEICRNPYIHVTYREIECE